MKKKNKNLPKPLKNYIILGVICGLTLLLVIYLCLWYREDQKYQATIPILRGVIPEITEVELSHYVQENDSVLLYLCVPSNEECRNFEQDLKKMIMKKGLKDDITYLNLEDDNQATDILRTIEEQYNVPRQKLEYPTFLLFDNGTVSQVLQGNDYTDLSMSEVEQFLDRYITE